MVSTKITKGIIIMATLAQKVKKQALTLELSQAAKREALLSAIDNCNGKFFTVTFVKADKSERVMTCRVGVKKHLQGGKDTKAHLEQYVNVWEPALDGDGKEKYRSINLDTTTAFNGNGQSLKFA